MHPETEEDAAEARYLLHARVAAGQLLPEVGDVVVVLLQVFLEVVAPEGQQRFLHLTVQLWKQRKPSQRGHLHQADATRPPQVGGGAPF